jgi:hypothetical protein
MGSASIANGTHTASFQNVTHQILLIAESPSIVCQAKCTRFHGGSDARVHPVFTVTLTPTFPTVVGKKNTKVRIDIQKNFRGV